MKTVNPRMHSAEHLLNRTMVRLFDCGRCFSAHIEAKKSKCDYRFGRPLTAAELQDIEARVNALIAADLSVTEAFLSREEAARVYALDRLPAEAGNRIRIVRIGDVDDCPCMGPHVERTAEIGQFVLISSDYIDGVLRLRYRLLGGAPKGETP